MRIILSAGLLLSLLTACTASEPRAQTAAHLSAVPVPAGPERDAAIAAIGVAARQHNFAQAITIGRDWAKRHPADLDVRRLEPAMYLLAGDKAGWAQSRSDLAQSWARLRGTVPPPAHAGFTIDIFDAGRDSVIADQCYETAGRFGVVYHFTVVSPGPVVNSFFTVESPPSDNLIAKQLGQPSPVFTLDHFGLRSHETVTSLPGSPAYADLRQRVVAYMANPKPISSSNQPGLSTENCGFNP